MSIEIDIPGWGNKTLFHLVSDLNGTLAVRGRLVSGVKERLIALSGVMNIHVVTADTFGRAEAELKGLPVKLHVIWNKEHEGDAKASVVKQLGKGVVSLGNGANDQPMFKYSDLSILVIGREGAYMANLSDVDIVVTDITHALDLLLDPVSIVATLRR